jgi:hypothetical protein
MYRRSLRLFAAPMVAVRLMAMKMSRRPKSLTTGLEVLRAKAKAGMATVQLTRRQLMLT